MRRWSTPLLFALTCAASLASSRPSFAQFGPGRGGMGPAGGAPPSSVPPEKEEGPAEKAPETQAENPALQPLPAWPQQHEKTLQFFEVHGYLRFRSYLFHALNLGIWGQSGGPATPFYIPYTEYNSNGTAGDTNNRPSTCAQRDGANCRTDNMTSADMRFRLEPTVNVTEQVRVNAQLDIFDNLVMGSTPDGYYLNNPATLTGSGIAGAYTSLASQSRTQVSPTAGVNSAVSSIRAKRAWAEVRTPFGELRFGRMPAHWGTGMLVNNGDCLDCDFGTNADRVMFATKLWGHFISGMWDWVATGPTTQIIGPQTSQGVYYNADTLDDVSQWILAVGKMDKPEEIRDQLDLGKVVFNYGSYSAYRQQDWDQTGQASQAPSDDTRLKPAGNSYPGLQATIHPRHAKAFTEDLWLRLNYRKLSLEAEGAFTVGTIGDLSDVYGGTYNHSTSILAGGFVFKGNYKFLHDALKLYLEVGYASGDDSEAPNADVNFQRQTLRPFNYRIRRFAFDPDYHVDQILFRRILGTVSNATYFKPGISYDIIDNFGARLDVMYALANRPVAYPGNSVNLGLELDAQLMYRNEEEGFYAGLVYGVLFPFGAFAIPGDIYGSQYAKDSPDIAQTFQARLIVKF